LSSLEVFPSVARGKVSVPQAVTPSYTRTYRAALLHDPSITYLVLRPPAMSLLQCPRQCNPASVIWVPSPGSVGPYWGWNGGKFENDKNITLLYQTISNTFCP
ncbi:unnamed protein product, partial [Staurois parvus]